MTYLTNTEINVIGIQRTGQHAITSWLIGHYDYVCYKNNMSQSGVPKRKEHGIQPPYWYFMPKVSDDWEVSDDPFIREDHTVILGTELTKLGFGLNPRLDNQKQEIARSMGYDHFSKSKHYILVIRNPYNHYASILNWSRNRQLSPVNHFKRMWKKMANECLSCTDEFPFRKTVVPYDMWFSSKEFRGDLASQLDLELNDRRLNTVMKIGVGKSWGSSFDGMKKNQKAQDMDVLKRWVTVRNDPRFRELLEDDEIARLAGCWGWERPVCVEA
jgi:hypothetical protein